MPEYLQTTIDKFTFRVARDRLYTADGVWLLLVESESAQHVRVGVTDFFQQHNGDVAFVNVKGIGTRLNNGDEFAEIETMKVNVSLSSPIAGTIAAVNPALELTPEIVNKDPYDQGWLAEVDVLRWNADRVCLLDATAYLGIMQEQAEKELKS